MKLAQDKNMQTIILLLVGTILAILSAITTEMTLSKIIYISASLFFVYGLIVNIKRRIKEKNTQWLSPFIIPLNDGWKTTYWFLLVT